MTVRRRALAVFGLAIPAVLGLLAFSAPIAQAVWLESGSTIAESKIFTGEVDTLIQLETPALNTEKDCTGLKIISGVVLGSEASEPNIAHVEILLEGCKAYVEEPLKALSACLFFETLADRETGKNPGNIIIKGLGEVFLHNGSPYLQVSGAGEGILAQIFSKNCLGDPNGIRIGGKIVLKLTPGETNAVEQLGEVANLTLFPNKLNIGENELLLLGSVWLLLTNQNPWGIC
jgi:hypothetical protein